MRRSWGPACLAPLLLLLARHCLLGHGNEGSSTGSCHCDYVFPSDSSPTGQMMEHLQKQLKHYESCISFIRFHLPRRSVCGGSTEPWVMVLRSCYDSKECGRAYYLKVVHQEQLPPPSTQVPKPTERASSDMGTQTYLPPTLLQSTTLLAGALSLDTKLTHASETTTYSVGHSPQAGQNQKQLEDNVGPTAGTSPMVPVLSLLVIVFTLTAVLLYMLCKRKRQKSQEHSPDLQLHYIPVAPDSNA